MKIPLAIICAIFALPAAGAEPSWLELETPRFTVVSQLNERDTRRWAVELDQFIDALQQLYAVDGLKLPPLTMVVFEDPQDFAPYKLRTPDGQADVAGFFANLETWSVIGLAGNSGNDDTRRVIYHEAVHWFTSGFDVESPPWFEEGLAEVFSTFYTRKETGHWGKPLQDNVDFLAYNGLMPMEQLLRSSQREALHGTGWFYPQAWLFVHYLMYADHGSHGPELRGFLRQMQTADLRTAFNQSFGISFEQMRRNMAQYLSEGRFTMTEMTVRDRSNDMLPRDADRISVDRALGRLAVAGGNPELARGHAIAVTGATPQSPFGFELLALAEQGAENATAQNAALDEAMRLSSKDATVYSAKAWRLILENLADTASLDEALSPAVARKAADLFIRSISLRSRNTKAYEGLALALLNSEVVTDQDDIVLSVGRLTHPTQGLIVVGQAAVARRRGNLSQALDLLLRSLQEPFTMQPELLQPIAALHSSW